MDQIHYPSIEEGKLSIISKLAAIHADYFSRPECPYKQTTKDIFMKKGSEKASAPVFDETLTDLPDTDQLILRINNLMASLDAFGRSAENSTEQNTFFRLSVTLMNQLVDLKQKTSAMKEHESFVAEVFSIMEQICNADQRAEIQARLERFDKGDKV